MIRPFSKLPVSKAADWGFNVTVCIATLCEQRRKLVCVTDNRDSFVEFSAERAVFKNYPLAPNWLTLYAGNDVEHAEPIIKEVRKAAWRIAVKFGRRLKEEEIVNLVDDAYSQQLQFHIEKKILKKHRFDSESFLKHGKTKCTPEVYARTWEKIDREEFSLTFLVAGFGEGKDGHIWLVKGDGAPVCYDALGFWAIGTGATAAMSSISFNLSRNQLGVYSSVAEAVYFSLAAKFMAESASDVGKSTWVVILSDHEEEPLEYVSEAGVESVRKVWERFGVPRVPSKQINDTIPKLIYPSKVNTIEALEAMMGKPGIFRKKRLSLKPSNSETSEREP